MSEDLPVRIAVNDAEFIGATAFFRNRAFLNQLGKEAARLGADGRQVRILNHACSIGAETYSLAIHLKLRCPTLDFKIDATDVSQGFRNFAIAGAYPERVMSGLTPEEAACFDVSADGTRLVSHGVRKHVTFLPVSSFVDFETDAAYDIVLVCNALVYVDRAGQAAAIDKIAGYNASLLAVTAFHNATIAEDLARNGYRAVMESFEDIHAGWIDRFRRDPTAPTPPRPPNIKGDAWMAALDREPGWRYRHGALFAKDLEARSVA